MSAIYDHGPLRTWQIIWKSGHVEDVQGHQVLLPSLPLFHEAGVRDSRLTIHGEFDGHWRLVLDVDYADVQSVRLLATADLPGAVA